MVLVRAVRVSWLVVCLAVAAGCGRSGLDDGDDVASSVVRDAGRDAPAASVDALGPVVDVSSPTSDVAGPSFDVVPRAAMGCVGAVRCRGGVEETCDVDDVWVAGARLCDRPPSCATPAMGISDCGPEHEDCCTTIEVPAGSYVRSFDGVSCPGGVGAPPPPAFGCYTSAEHPATISRVRLDKYLVTVARWQTFLASASLTGWHPTGGAGRHTHLNGGKGLVDVGVGGFEAGWKDAWSDATLLQPPGDNDNSVANMPINGVTWAQAYAFCIWDGGFLPSEAEWNYVAAGGDEQRVYPWSAPPQDTTVNCVHAAYTQRPDPDACLASGAYWVGAKSPAGDGRWGHADLAGLRPEWTLDWLRDYVDPCVDCVDLKPPTGVGASHVVRGYAHNGDTAPPRLLTSLRGDDANGWVGFRCARPARAP